MPEQLTIPGCDTPIPEGVILTVLQKFAPDKLMNVFERNSFLAHVQRGSRPNTFYNWYKYEHIAPAQMPALFAALAAKDAAEDAIARIQPEDEDAETN